MIFMVFIPGAPKTKGSMKHIGHGNMRESVKGSTEWKRVMSGLLAAEYAKLGVPPIDGPVRVGLTFKLPGDNFADVWAARSGDLDKLCRNALDALTDAKVYVDDVQVVGLMASKGPAYGHPGVLVSVEELEP